MVEKRNTRHSGDHGFLEPIHAEWVATLDAIRDCVFVVDSGNRLVRVNQAFAKLTKLDYNDLLGRSFGDVLPWLIGKNGILARSQVIAPDGRIYRLRRFAKSSRMNDHVHILEDITEQSALKLAEEKYQEDKASSMIETVTALAKALDSKDPYTAGHCTSVAYLSRNIARRLGYSDTEAQGIFYSAKLHDIGKLAIPAEILSRPGKLFDSELNLIRLHSEAGHAIVKDLRFPWPVHQVVLQHHERLDGSGYPHGLKGEEIAMAARIVAVADVFEAMSAHRPYRAALGVEAALAELQGGSGTRYDKKVVIACRELADDMLALCPEGKEDHVRG